MDLQQNNNPTYLVAPWPRESLPDDPVVVSATIQAYGGVRYYRCGQYFQRRGVRLHILVWVAANGPVPDGWHVHHLNHNRADNRLVNLQARPAFTHRSYHATVPSQARNAVLVKARDQASEWHRSKLGREWHRQQATQVYARREPTSHVCVQCGVTFESPARRASTKYCTNACKSRYWRATHRRQPC
jgi:hypothetical protein